MVEGGHRILIDVTRHFATQIGAADEIDAVLLTHAHRDASGGLPQLRAWWSRRRRDPIPVYASEETIAALESRLARREHFRFISVAEGTRRRLGPWTVSALEVPHAREPHYPTYAWRLRGPRTVVYASDVARLTPQLRRFCAGADLLVIDGAMWGRRLFSHLTLDADLPELCGWRVDRILLTQIGRSAPPHDQLESEVEALCRRARPAYDGMVVAP